MDNKVLDEAVEVALSAEYHGRYMGEALNETCDHVPELMRAALLAGVKVLLGEPMAWQYLSHAYGEPKWISVGAPMAEVFAENGHAIRALYAPSLGEGDGR